MVLEYCKHDAWEVLSCLPIFVVVQSTVKLGIAILDGSKSLRLGLSTTSSPLDKNDHRRWCDAMALMVREQLVMFAALSRGAALTSLVVDLLVTRPMFMKNDISSTPCGRAR